MPTTRPFAYNTGTTITGTEQIGDLSIGYPVDGFDSTGLQWWYGPDEDLGYAIGYPNFNGNQPTPTSILASVQFWRSKILNETSFIEIAEWVARKYISPQTFLTGNAAKIWLNDNGFWTSWITIPEPTPTPTPIPINNSLLLEDGLELLLQNNNTLGLEI
jgi:hypothetical protein